MIKLNIKNKIIREATFKQIDSIGLVIYTDNVFHHLIFINTINFSEYVETLEEDEDFKITDQFKNFLTNKPIVIGMLVLEDTNKSGPCFNALEVIYSANHKIYSGIGFGKEMYKIALAYAAEKRRPIRPNITGPEPSAQNVWMSLEKDVDVTKTFNQHGTPIEPINNSLKYFDFEEPKKTEPEIDDCEKNAKSSNYNFLNRAYYSSSEVQKLDAMRNRGIKTIKKYFTNVDETIMALEKISSDLFWSRYKK